MRWYNEISVIYPPTSKNYQYSAILGHGSLYPFTTPMRLLFLQTFTEIKYAHIKIHQNDLDYLDDWIPLVIQNANTRKNIFISSESSCLFLANSPANPVLPFFTPSSCLPSFSYCSTSQKWNHTAEILDSQVTFIHHPICDLHLYCCLDQKHHPFDC